LDREVRMEITMHRDKKDEEYYGRKRGKHIEFKNL
jgi:hypothetical protein